MNLWERPLKQILAFSRSVKAVVASASLVRLACICDHVFPSSESALLRAIVEANNRDVDGCTVQYPIAVTPSHEDSASFKNALQDYAVRAHRECLALLVDPHALSSIRQFAFVPFQTSRSPDRPRRVRGHHRGRAALPRTRLRVRRASAFPKKRRVANDEVRLRPCGFYRLAVRIMGENRVPVLDVIELAQNRLCRPADAVVIEPLQIANPNHHRGQLVRVDVGFQAVELRRVNLMR